MLYTQDVGYGTAQIRSKLLRWPRIRAHNSRAPFTLDAGLSDTIYPGRFFYWLAINFRYCMHICEDCVSCIQLLTNYLPTARHNNVLTTLWVGPVCMFPVICHVELGLEVERLQVEVYKAKHTVAARYPVNMAALMVCSSCSLVAAGPRARASPVAATRGAFLGARPVSAPLQCSSSFSRTVLRAAAAEGMSPPLAISEARASCDRSKRCNA